MIRRRPKVHSRLMAFAVAAYLLGVANLTFWSKAWKGFDGGIGFLAFGIAAAALFAAVTIALSFRLVAKPFYILFILAAVPAAYFTDTYGTIIDSGMIDNVLSSNSSEGSEFITLSFALRLLILAVLPVLLIAWVRIDYGPFRRKLLVDGTIFVTLLSVAAVLVYSNFEQTRRVIQKDHHAVTATFNPSGPISAAVEAALLALDDRKLVRAPYGTDARQGEWISRAGKPVVTVVVVGESARAMNFSLNGYGRDTNPELEKRGVLNFSDVTSCGTETAISLRCMFSGYTRKEYSKPKALSRQSLVDVFQHAGLDTYWWDNDGGSKGVADRVAAFRIFDTGVDVDHCQEGTCVDDIFLEPLNDLLGTVKRNSVIVLHQRGSHGPAYYLRYPPTFRPFTPDCRAELADCSKEEITNAYDNTIAYTDRSLARVIDLLKKYEATVSTAMFYVSDHGESLGENGLFMHGARYATAPREQTHVPLIVWLSGDYERRSRFDRACAVGLAAQPYSHDNVFHTLLGLMNVSTSVYKPELDMFKGCRDG